MNWEARGISFTEAEPSTDMISQETAIDNVRERLDPSGRAPLIAARFGMMRSEIPAIHAPGEQPRPVVWDRYVWVVTLADMKKPSSGKVAYPYPMPPFTPAPLNYVMDGATGDFIFAFG